MAEKWDDIFSAAQGSPSPSPEPEAPAAPPEAKPKKQRGSKVEPKTTPWADLEPDAKEATVRLNVDIPISLNDQLAEKARRLRKPKTELVRRLLEWALDDSVE